MFYKTLYVGICAIGLAWVYNTWYTAKDVDQEQIEEDIINAWKKHVVSPPVTFQRLHVGINSNVDLIVPGVGLLKALRVPSGRRENKDVLKNLDDLQDTFAHFFAKGSAAERAFLDKDIFQKIVSTGNTLENAQYYIGGNAALMASKISEQFPEVKINFIGPVGPKLLEMLPKSLNIPTASHISTDEVHLIMEYGVGETWGDVQSPVANRFITSYDESNSQATMLETYFESLDTSKTDLVLISGLHILEGQSKDFFIRRIQVVCDGLNKIPKSLPVHLELASMANEDFVKPILTKVISKVSSLGLNEQELAFASLAGNGPHSSDFHHQAGPPEIYKASDMVMWLLQQYGQSSRNPESRLTRVHFHCLAYHIIGNVKGAWTNSAAAVAAGSRMAGKQACDVQQLNSSIVDLKIPKKFKAFSDDIDREFDPKKPVISWETDGFEFSLSPVLVCKDPQKTVGLGDSISATGLMFSEYMYASK
ncbi:ADP-dependent glucokinase-like [Mizuhopecten yessoensis]|uniref:ADP-dependent glucokinase n=1 Tax=Mizuhopecten yessoensis TaxID=6573 RepID=A0A210QZ85_MIZYE|nr:ADP-dependent glucokinase-like [Mizuhopecten yessoensis]OWF54069.1 ADP-dependent glucokinase [Mizuhopecten yessoensis]